MYPPLVRTEHVEKTRISKLADASVQDRLQITTVGRTAQNIFPYTGKVAAQFRQPNRTTHLSFLSLRFRSASRVINYDGKRSPRAAPNQ